VVANFVREMTTPITPDELPPQYDAAATEKTLYAEWEAAGVFRADPARSDRNGGDRTPYTIVIPPPNVTGQGHHVGGEEGAQV
jgi:valyl-tRNA synthetase